MGGTGSGKTSGSGQALAMAFLQAGFGGLVLCAKPGERALWEQYARQAGRSESLIIFDDSGARRFNFLEYELKRADRLTTHNLVALFLRILEAARGGGGGQESANERFWQGAVSELLSNAFEALYAAWGRVRLEELMELIDSAATTPQEVDEARWRQSSFCFTTLERMFSSPMVQLPAPDMQSVMGYFFKRLPRLDPKTRTNIIATLTSLMHPFMRGYLRELFCTTTTILPEMTHEGAVIVLDLPVKAHSEAGILAQHIWKYLWQRATERRSVGPHTRPAFLWADECQFFLSEYDAEFQSTARSSRGLTVYLTQSLPTVHARMNGRMPEKTADALLANFQTKLFHANSCPITNQWAADMIGKVWQWVATHGSNEGWSESEGMNVNRGSSSTSSDRGNGSFSLQWGWGKNRSHSQSGGRSSSRSQHLDHEVLPSAFARLGKGGGLQGQTEAIVLQGGRIFQHTGSVWLKCAFRQ